MDDEERTTLELEAAEPLRDLDDESDRTAVLLEWAADWGEG